MTQTCLALLNGSPRQAARSSLENPKELRVCGSWHWPCGWVSPLPRAMLEGHPPLHFKEDISAAWGSSGSSSGPQASVQPLRATPHSERPPGATSPIRDYDMKLRGAGGWGGEHQWSTKELGGGGCWRIGILLPSLTGNDLLPTTTHIVPRKRYQTF